ncbi:MAG: lipid II:glycine glycyltransferase FemX [Halapricum sp.]
MTIDISSAEATTPAEWNTLVERARYTDAMHQWEALSVIARHADSTVHRLIGYKGQEPVGLFPVFERRYGPITAVFSPPPGLRIVYLGPGLLNMDKLTRRKTERRQRAFIEGVLEWIDERIGPNYVHVRTTPEYPDVRPFTWNDCKVAPIYTYHVDITGPESALLDRFSRDARTNIRDAAATDYDVDERGPEAIDRIVEQVRSRYAAQDVPFDVTASFVRELYEQTPDGTIRPFTCRVDGSFVGGILAVEFGDTIARWQGGVKPDVDSGFPINDVLDWEVLCAGRERDRTTYDLVGANTPRINRYKSKFGPKLTPLYDIERASLLGSLAARMYRHRK